MSHKIMVFGIIKRCSQVYAVLAIHFVCSQTEYFHLLSKVELPFKLIYSIFDEAKIGVLFKRLDHANYKIPFDR